MFKKVFGWLLFAWMTLCFVGAIGEATNHSGTRFVVDLAAMVVLAALAAVGLALAIGRSKPPADNGDSL